MERLRSRRSYALGTAAAGVLTVGLLAAGPAGAGSGGTTLRANVSGAVKNGAVSVSTTCGRGCASVRGTGTLSAPGMARVTLTPAVQRLRGGRATLALRIPVASRGKIRAALARGARVTTTLRVTGLDAAGHPLVSAAGRVLLGPS